jgi:hypothetical protein
MSSSVFWQFVTFALRVKRLGVLAVWPEPGASPKHIIYLCIEEGGYEALQQQQFFFSSRYQ